MASENRPEKTPSEQIQKIDFGGDVTLIVGQEGSHHLRVSKAALSLASDYFKTLFGSKFNEGSLADAGKDIVLEDDDPAAMVSLCKLLHFDPPPPPTPAECAAIAIVADKYGCVRALRGYIEFLVITPRLQAPTCVDLVNIIVACYLLDHPGLFHKYTRSLMFGKTQALASIGLSGNGLLIPTAAWLEIESRCTQASSQITALLLSLSHKPCPKSRGLCAGIETWLHIVTEQARAVGLTTLPAAHSIRNVISTARKLVLPNFDNRHTCRGHEQGHELPMLDTAFKSSLDAIEKECKGLCLDCVRAGKKSEGLCRTRHT